MIDLPESSNELFQEGSCTICGATVSESHDHRNCYPGKCNGDNWQDLHYKWHKDNDL